MIIFNLNSSLYCNSLCVMWRSRWRALPFVFTFSIGLWFASVIFYLVLFFFFFSLFGEHKWNCDIFFLKEFFFTSPRGTCERVLHMPGMFSSLRLTEIQGNSFTASFSILHTHCTWTVSVQCSFTYYTCIRRGAPTLCDGIYYICRLRIIS